MVFLKIESLSTNYGKLHVLKNIDLTIEKGTFTTILGPSGCGKSTLLRQIAGIEFPQSGTIWMDNINITKVQPQKRAVGMVFQNYALFPNLSVFENIAFGLRYIKESKANIEKKVMEMLELVNLTEKANVYPFQLSGGQKQRVALARALVLEPEILLLDEPLSALDAKVREKLRSQIKKIQRSLGLTVIFVTHDQEEALSISDRIIVMNHGEIEQDATPKELYDHPKSKYVAQFIGHYNLIEKDVFNDLFNDSIDANQVIVKPEGIYFSKEGLAVEIRESYLLGNIIRYECISGNQRFTIDCLNDHDVYQRHEIKKISVSAKQLIVI